MGKVKKSFSKEEKREERQERQEREERQEQQEPTEDKQGTNGSAALGSCGFRMKASVVCFVVGVASSVTGTVTLNIPGVGLGVFALLYSLGNICCLLSVTFLIGPKNQILTMFSKERAAASTVLLVCTGLTLASAIQWQNSVVALVLCVLQFLSFLWYTLSYVPYARKGVAKVCSVICC